MSCTSKCTIGNSTLQAFLKEHVPSLNNEKYHCTDSVYICTEYYQFLKACASVTVRLNKSPLAEAAEEVFGVHPREASAFADAMVTAFRSAMTKKVVDGSRTSKFVMGIKDARPKGVDGCSFKQEQMKEEQNSPPPKRFKLHTLPITVDESPGQIYKLYRGRSPTPAQRAEWGDAKTKVVR